MYRQGLGDCFLVTFYTGPAPVHMLIDCGTLGATTTGVSMADVVQHIADETGGHLHVLVATHEHKDHVSGFVTQQKRFDEFTVDRVWVAWTENSKDDLAVELRKYTDDLIASLQLAADALEANQAADSRERRTLAGTGSGVRELLGFYGELPASGTPLAAGFAETVHAAMSYATMRAGRPPDFLLPGQVLEPDWLPGFRVYVLGPPRSKAAMRILGAHGSPDLYHVSAERGTDLGLSARFFTSQGPFAAHRDSLPPADRQRFERGAPFDPRFRIEWTSAEPRTTHLASYDDPAAAWRRIDYDWLTAASDLALQLDNATNNTSLVLAIELIADGRVLLMPGDAQLGSWLSWHDLAWEVADPDGSTRPVTAADLLRRTVLYKVGHHASHNATARDRGLELMQREDPVALIPVDRAVALNKTPPWQMPAGPLYRRLLEKTRGRVLRSDVGWPEDGDRPPSVPQAEWDRARNTSDITVNQLFIEYRLR
jgi:hypothetical protein